MNSRGYGMQKNVWGVLGMVMMLAFCVGTAAAEISSEEAMQELQNALFATGKALMEAQKAIGMLQAQRQPETSLVQPTPTPIPTQTPPMAQIERGLFLNGEKEMGGLKFKEEIFCPIAQIKAYESYGAFKMDETYEDWKSPKMTLRWVLAQTSDHSQEYILYHADPLFTEENATLLFKEKDAPIWSEFRIIATETQGEQTQDEHETLEYDIMWKRKIVERQSMLQTGVSVEQSLTALENSPGVDATLFDWLLLVKNPENQPSEYTLILFGSGAPVPGSEYCQWCALYCTNRSDPCCFYCPMNGCFAPCRYYRW